MMTWFTENAPIKTKMKVVLVSQASLVAVAGFSAILLAELRAPIVATLAVAVALVMISVLLGRAFSKGVCDPYVTTVVRMERLAAGDLETPISFTHYKDCVGRMTVAMRTFSDAIIQKQNATQAIQNQEKQRAVHEVEKAEHTKQVEAAIVSISSGLTKLAEGAIDYRIDTPLGADVDKLRLTFNSAMDTLQETLVVIGGNSDGIRSGSKEIAGAADELAHRTEKQAANLEETAAALDSITVTVKRTAEGARHAREVVTTAKSDAEASGVVAQDAVEAMKGIASSSRQINQIIGVIDEIAFQTNLLALNAGVEAARAGEAGRGFAVVASEVRALAQRSAEAAKEIKTLIANSTSHVDRGVELVIETGKALSRIVTHVSDINAVVVEISSSAQEQSVGLQEVNTAVTQMDQMTQQNAAMVEESTAASHAMLKEAESLAELLTHFNLGKSKRVVAFAAKPARAPAPHAQRPVPSVSRGGQTAALRKSAPVEAEAGWEEF